MVSKVERLSITIPIECANTLNERAASDKMNRSAIIAAALKAYLSDMYSADVTQSYSDNDTKMSYLESEIISLNARLNDKDALIQLYKSILGGQVVTSLPVGEQPASDQDKEDRLNKQDKKQGALTRLKAWLGGK